MARYTNQPEIEGINSQDDGQASGREFITLGIVFLLIMGVLSAAFIYAGQLIGPFIPFAWEQKAAGVKAISALGLEEAPPTDPKRQALTQLAAKVSAAMDLPEGMTMQVHYLPDDTLNAFATLGGHVFFFDGLLDLLEHEEAVAALMAHEFAHVRARHVARSIGGAVMAQVLWGVASSGGLEGAGASIINLQTLTFSRKMEAQADAAALKTSLKLYGHAGGYYALFDVLGGIGAQEGEAEAPKSAPLTFLRSHPDVAARKKAADDVVPVEQRTGPMTPWG